MTMKEIWLPRPYLWHLTSRESPMQVLANSDYLEATSSGGLNLWMEIIFGIKCSFDFSFYPFDKHKCYAKFSSAFPEEAVRYLTSGLERSFYGLEQTLMYEVEYEEITQREELSFFDGFHNWSACGFYIHLDRKVSPALINFFMPSVFIVIITFCGYVMVLGAILLRRPQNFQLF